MQTVTTSTICSGKLHFNCLVERIHINFKLDEDGDHELCAPVSDVLARLSRLSENETQVGSFASHPFDWHSTSTAHEHLQHLPSSDPDAENGVMSVLDIANTECRADIVTLLARF